MTARFVSEVFADFNTQLQGYSKMTEAIQDMVKPHARLEEKQIRRLKQMMVLYQSAVGGTGRFLNHQDMAEARDMATWINSLN